MGLPGRGGRGLCSRLCSWRSACALLGDTGTPWRRQGGCALFFWGAAPRVLWGCAHPDGHRAAQGGQNSEPLRNPNFLLWFVVLRRSPCPERGGFWARGYPPCFGVHTPFWGTHSILGYAPCFGAPPPVWDTPAAGGGVPTALGAHAHHLHGAQPTPPRGCSHCGGGSHRTWGCPHNPSGGGYTGQVLPRALGCQHPFAPPVLGGGHCPRGGTL